MSEIAPPEARGSVAGFQDGAQGVIPPTDPERRGTFLSDVITELGFAEEDAVEHAVQAARNGGTVGELLIASGAIDEEQLAQATAERAGLDYVNLDDFEVDFGAAGLIGRSAAQRYGAVPIAFAGDGALIVALEDPTDALAISDIEVMTRSDVRRVVASPRAIGELIERIPEVDDAPTSARAAHPEVEPEDPSAAPEWAAVELPADVTFNELPEIEEPEVAPEQPSGPDPEAKLRAQLGEAGAERKRLRAELADAETAQERLRAQVADAEQKRLRAELAEAEAERERLRAELADAEAEPERLRAELAEAEAEQEEMRTRLAEAEAEADRARDEAANANSGRDLIRNEAMRLAKELKRLESAKD